MLKKCAKIERIHVQENQYDKDGLPQELYDQIKKRQQTESFKRGAMTFEDYNYDLYNKYILIDPNI